MNRDQKFEQRKERHFVDMLDFEESETKPVSKITIARLKTMSKCVHCGRARLTVSLNVPRPSKGSTQSFSPGERWRRRSRPEEMRFF